MTQKEIQFSWHVNLCSDLQQLTRIVCAAKDVEMRQYVSDVLRKAVVEDKKKVKP